MPTLLPAAPLMAALPVVLERDRGAG